MSKQKIAITNQQIFDYFIKQNKIDQKLLHSLIKDCNVHDKNLGHVLVQRRLISVKDLSSFYDYSQRKTRSSLKTELKLGTTHKDFGKYILVEEIARGGMGIVYKALQKDIKRYVALKIILGDERLKSRFFREAKACAALSHPHIVPVYEIGSFEGTHFFSMKYVEGVTLSDVLKRDDYITAHRTRVMHYLVAITKALYCAHKQGIVHRDIKPSNILISNEHVPFLADFGLAKIVGGDNMDLTKTGEVIGTPFFMSPEQVRGHKLDIRTDIYSIGVILYQALTQKLPFESDHLSQLYQKIIHSPPVSPKVYREDVPDSFEDIGMKCLQKDAHFRYQSASELAEDLTSALSGTYRKNSQIKERSRKLYYGLRKNIAFSLLFIVTLFILTSIFIYSDFFYIKSGADELQNVQKLMDNHKYSEAKLQLDKLAQKYPQNAEVYAKRAKVYYAMDDSSQAFRNIIIAIELNKNIDYLLLKANWLVKEKLYDKAIQTYNITRKISPRPLIDLHIANTLFLSKRYTKALPLYKSLVDKLPEYKYDIQLSIAKIHYLQNNYSQSYNILQNLAATAKGQSTAREIFYYYGLLLREKKQYSLATKMFKRVLENGKSFLDTHEQLGYMLVDQSQFGEAIEHLKSSDSKNTKRYYNIAKCYQGKYLYKEAISYYDKCILREPWKYELYAQRGLCHEQVGNLDQSGEDLLKASELGKDHLDSLAHLYENMFNYRSLEKQFEIEKRVSRLLLLRYTNQNNHLFENEYKQLTKRYMKQYDDILLAPVPPQAQITTFINRIIDPNADEVRDIAANALSKMYHNREVLQQISQVANNSNSLFLQKLYSNMQELYLELQKKHVRQLLMRYYVIKDTTAIYKLKQMYIDELFVILREQNEPSILRFFAARALIYMRSVSVHEKMVKYTKSPDASLRLLVFAAFKKENIQQISTTEKFSFPEDSFLRILEVEYVSRDFKYIEHYLQDPDMRVKITAANRLWEQGYLFAEQVFVKGFAHKDPLVRAFSHNKFWLIPSQKRLNYAINKYFASLKQALHDDNPSVQRVAISRLSRIPGVKVIELLKPLLRSPHSSVKLHTLIAIGIRGDLATLAKFFETSQESYLQASLFVVTKMTSDRSMRNLSMLPIISNAIENENPNFAIFTLKTIGRVQKFGAQYILKYLKHPKKHVRLGTILGLYRHGEVSMLPKLAPFLESSDRVLVNAATFSIMHIAARSRQEDVVAKYERIIRKKNLHINGAYAFVRHIHLQTDLGSAITRTQSIDWNILYPLFFRNTYKFIVTMKVERGISYTDQLYFLQKAMDLAPQNDRYLFYTGLTYYAAKDYKQAISYFKKAVDINKLKVYFFWMAKVYYEMREYPLALSEIEKYQEHYFVDKRAARLYWQILDKMSDKQRTNKALQRLRILELK